MKPCDVCGCEIYEEKDGYLFCTSCCTQSQNYVDLEIETDGRILNKTVLKDETDKENIELTTWEEYNYILVGLINQLIDLGAKEEVKLTALQLWTEYLRKAEVAFFSKSKNELPRLPLAYKNKDAIIMYDKKCSQRNKSKRRASASLSSAKSRRKRQKQIIESEYNSTICSTMGSSSKPASIPIHFTRNARRLLKKKMPKKHIKVHEREDRRPKCHKILVRDIPYKNRIQHTSSRILVSLMYIALNMVNDKIQLGDMLRWFREGHLSFMHIERFFPKNYKLSRRMVEQMGQIAALSHYRLRLNTLNMLQFINIETLRRPDFIQLCRRYVIELGLPDTVFKYSERLIRLHPPVMDKTQSFNTEIVPNYEGRAMAYIIFILKLIFGLNGTTEELLSDSAEKVNYKIGKQKLFNFRKWMHFVQLRKVVLSDYHFPTKMSTGTTLGSHSHLYINHLNSILTDISMETVQKPVNPSKVIEPLFEAMLKIADIHQVNEDKKINHKLCKFPPSLTPNSEYLSQLLKNYKSDAPKLLEENFQQSEFDVYLKKNLLRRNLHENYGISLKFRKIKRKIINMNKNVSKHIFHRGAEDILRKFNSKIGWIEVINKRKQKLSLDRLIENEIQLALNRDTISNDEKVEVKLAAENAKFLVNENNYEFTYEPVERNLSDSETEQLEETSDFDTEPEFVFENTRQTIDELQPNRDLESNVKMFDNQSEDELSDDDWNDADEGIEFFIPNFHYWRRNCHTGKNFGQNYEKMERELPKSFNWLLHECARIIENKPHELYTELLTIETGFICFMKPLTQNTRRVKFRKWTKNSKRSLNNLGYINHLKHHCEKINSNITKHAPSVGRWGRQSPGPEPEPPPPPLPPRTFLRQSSLTKIGYMLTGVKKQYNNSTRNAETSWCFSQIKGALDDNVTEADIISCVEFNHDGELLATGDKGGRVVIFQRDPASKSSVPRRGEYNVYSTFQSHEPEFDYLKSLEIEEKINKIRWLKRKNQAHFLLSTNDKTIKLWKVSERDKKVEGYNTKEETGHIRDPSLITSLRVPAIKPMDLMVEASPRRIFANAHTYHINSISVNSDQETYLSADDLRINLWHLEITDQSFNIVDIKPANMEELTEVITAAEFHPTECNLFVYSSSKGTIRLCDMRSSALCDRHSKQFEEPEDPTNRSFFSEIISSISDVKLSNSGRYMISRDYLSIKVWDLHMETKPIETYPVHEYLRTKLCSLYENDCIFDKFECCWNGSDSAIMTGSYNNFFRVFDRNSKREVTLEASRDVIQPKTILKPRKVCSGGKRKKDEISVDCLDFNKKILHTAWHPLENIIAVAATNNLFIFQDKF